MLFKTSNVLLLIAALAGCGDPCPDGVGGDMGVRDGEIYSTGYSALGSFTTDFGTLDEPSPDLVRCENIPSLRFYGPIKGPLTAFDHVNSLGLLEFNWLDIDELDAFPGLRFLGDLAFNGFNGPLDPDRGDDDFIPPDAEEMRVGVVGGFPQLESIRNVRQGGAASVGSWVGFGSLTRIDSFDFRNGTSATSFEGLSTVESMGELRILGSLASTLADFRSLVAVDGDLALSEMPHLRTLGLDALETVGGDFDMGNLGLRAWSGLGNVTEVGGAGDFQGMGCVAEEDFEAWASGVTFGDGYVASRFGVLIGGEACDD